MRLFRSGFAAFLVWLLLLGLFALLQPWWTLPAHWDPRAPLSLQDPITPVTRWKMQRLESAPQQCLALLESAADEELQHLPLEDYTPVAGCPLSNVVRVERTGVRFNAPFTLTCPVAVSWLMFEQQRLQSLALQHLGSPITRIEHFGTFACRNIYHRENARRSEHASAAAFDVAAFTTRSGVQVSVLKDWDNGKAANKSLFLREAHDAACDYFGTVLGPEYNAPHANHFHFDNRNFGYCR
ncbi:MAG: extensin family protein [Halopseudomonas sp.]|uniref:extensin-like domain-containing protein n=1 Tax=Halopseudomonas sp. TaxID=2901191 RepID=UPI003001D3A9